jgi:signal transduction histidine kinase/FixJ family two-component response regulator
MRPTRILVVDDYEPLRFLKSHVLAKAGYDVRQAATASEALAAVAAEKPEAVLLDVNLPDMDGIEVCRRIKCEPSTRDIVVIFSSAAAVPDQVRAAGDGHVDSLRAADLLAAVGAALDPRSSPAPGARSLPTQFAPAERSSREEIERQAAYIASSMLAVDVLDKSPCATAVLNQHRQVVFCNRTMLSLAGLSDRREALGLRPGELVQCLHASGSPGGCGTSANCQTCGAVRAVLEAQGGAASRREVRINHAFEATEQPLDLLVSVSPLNGDGRFVLCSIQDNSAQKRRKVLERLFFHDLLNVARSIDGLAAELAPLVPLGRASEISGLIGQCAEELLAEIRSQQLLLEAETSALDVRPTPVNTGDIVRKLVAQFSRTRAARGRVLNIDGQCAAVDIVTDERLLKRVIANMLNNALEASAEKETVIIGCAALRDAVEFWVHNPAVMPQEAQLQVFQRSFSTKGEGRGLGTYSMKLLVERYLGGAVSFRSNGAEGTTFLVRIPAHYTQQ